MSPTPPIASRARFGEFEVDLSTGELWCGGKRQTLAPQQFQVLRLLLENRGRLVTREDLVNHLWPAGTFVDYEQGLKKAVKRLREALRDDADNPRFIETLPRRGYRFIGIIESEPGKVNSTASPPTEELQLANSSGPSSRSRRILSLAAVVLLLSLVIALGWWARRRAVAHDDPHSPLIRSLAVLPLENLSGDASQEYFADGMTDELIT